MASKEFEGPVEYSIKRTAEATGVVLKGLEPVARALADNLILSFYFFSLTHPRLRQVFGGAYYRSYKRREERLKKFPVSVMV